MTWDVQLDGEVIENLFLLTRITDNAPLQIKLPGKDGDFVPLFTSPAELVTMLPALCREGGLPPALAFNISALRSKQTAQAGNLLVAVLSMFKDQGLRLILNPENDKPDLQEIIEENGTWRLRQNA